MITGGMSATLGLLIGLGGTGISSANKSETLRNNFGLSNESTDFSSNSKPSG